MIFGMPTLIEIESLEESLTLCKSLGLGFVELNMNLPQYQIEALEKVEYLDELSKKYGLFYTIHLDENLNVCDFNKAVASAYTETVLRTVEAAKKLNAPVLNMHMNHGVHFTLPRGKVCLFEKYRSQYMTSWKNFRTLCEEAIGDSNIKISIENTDGFRSYEAEAAEYLLESNAFALTWDIGHSQAVGNSDETFIMSHENKLCHFHVHDAVLGKDHMILGNGDIDLKDRLKTAKAVGARCVIETKTAEALKASVAWLKSNNYIKDKGITI